MEPTFRAAKESDLDRLLEIHLASYPDGRGVDERRRNFVANPLGGLENLVVCQRAGEVVAHAFLFQLQTMFGGRAVATGAIASVAVAPEARGEGVAGALMKHLHVVSDVRGDALTMLYAYRSGFYARLGYAQASSRKRLLFDPRAVPDAWRVQARGRVRRARAEDRDAFRRAHLRAAARASGWIVRSDASWERLFARERRHHLVLPAARGEIAGYVAFELVQAEPHARTTLDVAELVSDDDEARRALLGALGALRDQVADVVLEIDASDPLEVALTDADAARFGTADVEHTLGTLVGGPMVRVEDVPRAIEARGYAAPTAFDLVIEDADTAVHVRVDGGRATVSAAEGGGGLATSRRGLAAILYGGLRPADAVRLGVAEARRDPDGRILARADQALAIPPVAPLDAF
jgi:predicted acetyltransferase